MVEYPGRMMGPEKLFNNQGSFPPSSGVMHPNRGSQAGRLVYLNKELLDKLKHKIWVSRFLDSSLHFLMLVL